LSPDLIFSVANTIALLTWILLAATARRRGWADTVTGMVVPLLLAILYIAIVAVRWSGSSGGFSSLTAVSTLFGDPWLLLAGWLHYLAFDLLVGNWEVRDARQLSIGHVALLPCLALTFMFGPAGWAAYLAVRRSFKRPATSV
jgi:hypothetical protein